MSVLLKSVDSARYVENSSKWTDEPERARRFGGATDALFYCCCHQLANMEILGDGFTIPVPDLKLSNGQDRLAEWE